MRAPSKGKMGKVVHSVLDFRLIECQDNQVEVRGQVDLKCWREFQNKDVCHIQVIVRGREGILLFHRGLLRPTMFIIIKTPFPISKHLCEVELQSEINQGMGSVARINQQGARSVSNPTIKTRWQFLPCYSSQSLQIVRPITDITFKLLFSQFPPFFKPPEDFMHTSLMGYIIL